MKSVGDFTKIEALTDQMSHEHRICHRARLDLLHLL